jgi:sulfur-oxidizing protein SoxZ
MALRPRVRVPKEVKKGDTVTIKTLIAHKMETGLRKNKKTGKIIPRKIINKFEAKLNGQLVFSADLQPAIAANPYIAFTVRPDKSGTMEFAWTDDDGSVYRTKADMKVV